MTVRNTHKFVKLRRVINTQSPDREYFHVRVSSVANTVKKVSQRYITITEDLDFDQALHAANSIAAHLERRHKQRAVAAENVKPLANYFFSRCTPIALTVSTRKRYGVTRIFLKARNNHGVKQTSKEISLQENDPELLVFDNAFNRAFSYSHQGQVASFSAANLEAMKIIVRACLVQQFHTKRALIANQ